MRNKQSNWLQGVIHAEAFFEKINLTKRTFFDNSHLLFSKNTDFSLGGINYASNKNESLYNEAKSLEMALSNPTEIIETLKIYNKKLNLIPITNQTTIFDTDDKSLWSIKDFLMATAKNEVSYQNLKNKVSWSLKDVRHLTRLIKISQSIVKLDYNKKDKPNFEKLIELNDVTNNILCKIDLN